MEVRQIQVSDASEYLKLRCALDEESKMLLMEAGERTTTEGEIEKSIQEILNKKNSMIFLAFEGERMVGFLSSIGGNARRNFQTVYIVIGILEAFTGRGIGKLLFQRMESWARSIGSHRLELGLMAHNERALKLYLPLGFALEGRKREVFLVDGNYYDELMMGKLLK